MNGKMQSRKITFDFQKEILEYWESDVEILHKNCKIFCKHFKSTDPQAS